MNFPKISVVVPVYNVEKYIRDCLDSLLKQNYPNYEIILIDDGSPDRCGEICDEYAGKDVRVSVIHQKNKGVSAARNRGLQIAKGDYITFADPDDWVDSNYLAILAKHMQPNGMSVCGYAREKKGIKSSVVKLYSGEEKTIRMNKVMAKVSVLDSDGMGGYVWGKLFDKNIIMQYGLEFPEDLVIFEDSLFVMQYLFYITEEVVIEKKIAYHYRWNLQGAVLKKHNFENAFDVIVHTSVPALMREKDFIENDKIIQDALVAKLAAAKHTAIVLMDRNDKRERAIYNAYLHDIRNSLLTILLNTDIGISWKKKIYIIFLCIHPKIEYYVRELWSLVKGRNRSKNGGDGNKCKLQ